MIKVGVVKPYFGLDADIMWDGNDLLYYVNREENIKGSIKDFRFTYIENTPVEFVLLREYGNREDIYLKKTTYRNGVSSFEPLCKICGMPFWVYSGDGDEHRHHCSGE